MMTCRHTLSLLEDFLEGNLSPSETESVGRHAEDCRDCRTMIEEAQVLKEQMKSLPAPDPGELYFEETTRMILARTGSLERFERPRPVSPDPAGKSTPDAARIAYLNARFAFARSLASFAVAVLVLISAVYIGSKNPQHAVAGDAQGPRYLVSVDLAQLLNKDNDILVTADEQNKISQGMLLMGAPGALGRGPALSRILLSME